MSDHKLDRIHADEFINSAVSDAGIEAANRDCDNIRRGACVVCEQVGQHEDECPEGYHPITENDVREAMLRQGWIIPTTMREVELIEQIFPESEIELPESLKEPPKLNETR